jgi:hypothetical protein
MVLIKCYFATIQLQNYAQLTGCANLFFGGTRKETELID